MTRPGAPALLLYAPPGARHDPVPVHHTRIRPAATAHPRGTQPPNTVIISAGAGHPPALPAATGSRDGRQSLAPLFCLLPAGRDEWLPYTMLSYTGADALYIVLPGPALHGRPSQPAHRRAWAADLAARHRQHAGQLGNHRCWFRNLYLGTEIEHKFTLRPRADIWRLAVRTHRLLQAGQRPGWICEHGNNGGFEQWDFTNHLIEITDPETERGYIAFIPAIDGRSWIIRRKRFTRDQSIRREDLIEDANLGPCPDLRQVVRDRFGAQPARAWTYRRVRYNVMLESLATGHIYSIMYDRCTSHPGIPPLVQAETEYIHSRTIRLPPPAEVITELDHVTAWTRHILHREQSGGIENNLSKLTWLRQHALTGDGPEPRQ